MPISVRFAYLQGSPTLRLARQQDEYGDSESPGLVFYELILSSFDREWLSLMPTVPSANRRARQWERDFGDSRVVRGIPITARNCIPRSAHCSVLAENSLAFSMAIKYPLLCVRFACFQPVPEAEQYAHANSEISCPKRPPVNREQRPFIAVAHFLFSIPCPAFCCLTKSASRLRNTIIN